MVDPERGLLAQGPAFWRYIGLTIELSSISMIISTFGGKIK
jgi:hypothetical protein